MLKKTGIQTKQNRIRRRFTSLSGDFFTAMTLLSMAVFLSVLFIYVYNVMMSSPYFQIKEISVRGLKELTEKDILASANIKPQQNLLAVNKNSIIRRVCSNHWVETVYVGKELPGKLVLDFRERIPLALVKRGGDFYLMDVKGHVFKRLGGSDEVDLPVITGAATGEATRSPLLLSALGLIQRISKSPAYAHLGTISEIHIDSVFGLALVSDNGLYLKLGTDDFENKLRKLKAILTDLENRGMKTGFLCVDLSDHSKVTVKRKYVPEKTQDGDQNKNYLI